VTVSEQVGQRRAPGENVGERVKALAKRLKLRDIRFAKIAAELRTGEPRTIGSATVARGVEYSVESDSFLNRYSFHVVLYDGEAGSAELATMDLVVLLEFELGGGPTPDEEVLSLFLQQNTVFMVYPYLREAAQSLSSRLGLDKLVFGLWLFDTDEPDTIVAVPTPGATGGR
jgi:hypothetical protein